MLRLLQLAPILVLAACAEITGPARLVSPDLERQVAKVLLTLAHHQEAFWADSLTYSPVLPASDQWTTYYRGVSPPPGVHVRVLEADSSGWQAVASAEGMQDCLIYVGLGYHVIPGLHEGIPSCWQPASSWSWALIDSLYEPVGPVLMRCPATPPPPETPW
jgi:hypothetical protein